MTIRIKHVKKTVVTANSLKNSLKEGIPSTKKLKTPVSTWVGTSNDLIINWGSSSPLDPGTRAYVMNKPENVKKAVDKLKTFEVLSAAGLSIPVYKIIDSESSKVRQLADFIRENDVRSIVIRNTLTGSGGEGIHVLSGINDLLREYHDRYDDCVWEFSTDEIIEMLQEELESSIVDEAIFVGEYFRAVDEFRVHIMCGEIIATQRKALRRDGLRPDEPDFTVRSHSNGFIFQINDIAVPDVVLQASKDAVNALGLDFGAVDIRYNEGSSTYKVLEVNSAPALVGATLQAYTSGFLTVHKYLQRR